MHHFLKEAKAIQDEIIANRRYIHQHGECGLDLPQTSRFIFEKLKSYGYEPKMLGGGVTCLCGQGEPTLLLRADMDALPQTEDTGLEFSCKENACHSCGHDGHSAMLLGAAKILKNHEAQLSGTVKFMFQPGEETLRGCQQMIDAGILENPKVHAAIGLHLHFGPCGYEPETGMMTYAKSTASADEFQITVTGKSAHGSSPFQGCSALSAAANIVVAVQQLLALEVSCDEPTVVSFGSLHSGKASNIVPDTAVLSGTIRAFSRENRNEIKNRLGDLAQSTAQSWGASAKTVFINGVGPNIYSPSLTKEMLEYCKDICETIQELPPIKASEDFANLGEHVPTFFANLCAGGPSNGFNYSMHNPKAVFDENALPYGSAVFCNCAVKWLENHCKE